VDTGLTHLGVALGRPSVGIYVSTHPAYTGLYGESVIANLGGPQAVPSAQAVFEILERHA
jgi:heptosyltransferase-1